MPLDSRQDDIRPLGTKPVARLRRQSIGDTAADWSPAVPLLALFAGWLVMVWPWLAGTVTVPWDAKAQFLPQIQFLAQSLARGESPFWAPYVFSGQNQIADPQSMIFSPPFLLLALFDGNPSSWAVDVTVLLVQLAGGAAMLLWFRDQRWNWGGALLAGLTFAFGASMAWRLQHTGQVLSLAYWPMAMLALDRMLTRHSFGFAAALGFLGAAILLGRDQVALLVLYLLFAQGLWRIFSEANPWQRLLAAIPRIVTVVVIAALLAGIPVLLSSLLVADSNRPSIDLVGAGRGSLHPALLITALIPQLFGAAFRMEDYWGPPSFAWNDTGLFIAQNMGQIYIGLLPILLLLIAALRGQMWNRDIRFFVIAFAVILFYALGWYTPFFQAVYAFVPGVDLYRRPADATFLIGGLGAILAGYATHSLFNRPWEVLRKQDWFAITALAGTALGVALILALAIDRFALLAYPLIAAGVALAASSAALAVAVPRLALEPWTAALLLGGITVADLAYNNGPSTSSGLPSAGYEEFDPSSKNPIITTLRERVAADRSETRRDRIELLGLGFDWPNVSLSQQLENTLGYNPVRMKLYSDATGAGDIIGMPADRKFSPLLPSYRSLLVDLLCLRYVAAGAPLQTIDPKLKPGDWRLIAETGGAWIYENPHALPRVMFATTGIAADFDALLRTGAWPDFDPTKTVLLEAGHEATFAPSATNAKVAIAAYHNTRVDIDADSANGGFVVLNDLWQQWWFAEIDGQPAPLLRANVLFRSVKVPGGKHRISFAFRPLQGAWAQLVSQAR